MLDNEVLGSREVLEGTDAEFIHGDIRDRRILDAALKGVDAVVHLAADTRVIDSIADPQFNFDNNVTGTFNLLMAMREAGAPRLVNASTGGAILGEVPPPVHEDMAPAPTSPYGAAKLAVEGYCSAFSASYGMQAVSLRFSNVYGPLSFHKGSVVAAFFRAILAGKPLIIFGDGSQQRDYVHIDDLCDGIIAGLTSAKSGAFQLGTGVPVTLNELVEEMRAAVGPEYAGFEVIHEDFRPGEIRNTYCDISKAKRELGYSPRVGLKEGLKETWAWFMHESRRVRG